MTESVCASRSRTPASASTKRLTAGFSTPSPRPTISTTRRLGGSGLGLVISKQLAELTQGSIGLTSQLGKGSIFHVSVFLARAQCHSHSQAQAPDGPRVSDGLPPELARKHILVEEDSLANQEAARAMLENLGCYRIQIVADGRQALRELGRADYDLVLMDCQLPELDGFDATRRYRRRESELQHPAVPIVALTARAATGAREECLAAGMSDYLSKPFTLAQLRSKVEAWLSPPNPDPGG